MKMISLLLIMLLINHITMAMANIEPVYRQMETFLQMHPKEIGVMTTSAGAPVSFSEATNTLNTRLIFNEYVMDTLTQITREQIPERAVHTKAGGAFGYFEVTKNVTHICKSKFLSKIGKRTPIAARFSPIIVEKGGPDVSRDSRGFAVKFYTEEGNFDFVGLNFPVFVVKDPRLFPSFAHSLKKNPVTNLYDANMMWDFFTQQPETSHLLLYLYGDNGIPNGYGNMPGFSIHTFQVENKQGDVHFVRFHFVPDGGIKFLTSEEASEIASYDPDYNIRNLYNSIQNGNFPSWTVSLQILSQEDVKNAGPSEVFDVTRILSTTKYPLTEIGKVVLNRNALNYFAEIEQLAFNPANLIPGILGAPDTLFGARRIAYREAAYYRLSSNFNRIRVNCPFQSEIFTYNRDGTAPVGDNEKDIPNYYPNSFNGPAPLHTNSSQLIEIVENLPNNFDQSTYLYENGMSIDERDMLIKNILSSLRSAAPFLQERAVKIFTRIHPNLGNSIQQGLLSNVTNAMNK